MFDKNFYFKKRLRSLNKFGSKVTLIRADWKRKRLAFAFMVIAFCFLIGNDVYQVRANVKSAKKVISGNRKVINYLDAVKQKPFSTVLSGKTQATDFYIDPNKPAKNILTMLAGSDTCSPASQIFSVPYFDSSTTVGATDNYDLPADTTSPTVTGCPTCTATGAGPAASLPRGAVYTGTGTAPDVAYRIAYTTSNNSLTATVDPLGAEDLSLIVYTNVCSSSLSDAIVIDDTGVGGAAESVTITNMPAGVYHIVVDGYSAGATPPGPSGTYSLNVTGSAPIPATAAGSTVSGRVLDSEGSPLANQRIIVTEPDGTIRSTVSNSFGNYQFEGLVSGRTYIFQIEGRKIQFESSTQVIFVTESLSNLNFIALP